jgi:hypothetical protein
MLADQSHLEQRDSVVIRDVTGNKQIQGGLVLDCEFVEMMPVEIEALCCGFSNRSWEMFAEKARRYLY